MSKKNKNKLIKDKIIRVRLDSETYHFINFVAEIHGKNVSEIIRESLSGYRNLYINQLKRERYENIGNIN